MAIHYMRRVLQAEAIDVFVQEPGLVLNRGRENSKKGSRSAASPCLVASAGPPVPLRGAPSIGDSGPMPRRQRFSSPVPSPPIQNSAPCNSLFYLQLPSLLLPRSEFEDGIQPSPLNLGLDSSLDSARFISITSRPNQPLAYALLWFGPATMSLSLGILKVPASVRSR